MYLSSHGFLEAEENGDMENGEEQITCTPISCVLNDHGASAKVQNVGRGPDSRSMAGKVD